MQRLRERIHLGTDTAAWLAKAARIPRLTVYSIDWQTAALADELDMHADPADRFIAATAVQQRAMLITKDSLLRSVPFIKTIW